METIRVLFIGAHAVSEATRVNLRFSYCAQIMVSLLAYTHLRQAISTKTARGYLALAIGNLILLSSGYALK